MAAKREAGGAARKPVRSTVPATVEQGARGRADENTASPAPVCKITYVMPAYCNEGFKYEELARAIDCLLAQTDPLWQVIVCHDGPNDTVRDMIIEYEKHYGKMRPFVPHRFRMREFPHRGLRGGHHMIDSCVDAADGEFICIYNADNVVYADHVREMWREDADIVTCQLVMNDHPGYIMSGRGFMRGRLDRLNYIIRTSVAKRIHHGMRIDADYNYVCDAWDMIERDRGVRVHHIDRVLAEHN